MSHLGAMSVPIYRLPHIQIKQIAVRMCGAHNPSRFPTVRNLWQRGQATPNGESVAMPHVS